MTVPARRRTIVRVDLTLGSVAWLLAGVGAGLLAMAILISARRVFSWVIACAIAAALIELAADSLARWVRRPVAVVLVLVVTATAAALLVMGVLNDLDQQVRHLKEVAPVAAHGIEQSQRVGSVARDLELEHRVTTAVERLSRPSSGLAGWAASSVGAYVVCLVLTLLFLSWGPKLVVGGLAQLPQDRAAHIKEVVGRAFVATRKYVALSVFQSVVFGLVTWLACLATDLPAPAALALAVGVISLVPNVGILVGSVPVLLLSAGLAPFNDFLVLLALFVGMQALSVLVVQRLLVRRAGLYVGPALITIAFLLGFELYGAGGAVYAAVLMVLGVATLEAATDTDNDMTTLG